MPEHDLLLQVNKDVKVLCGMVGRLEEKIDASIAQEKKHCAEYAALAVRVTFIEKCRSYDKGKYAGIAVVVSGGVWVLLACFGRV